MVTDIQTVAVIGAGVMGASIAAHCANAGCQVMVYDVDRASANRAIAKLGRSNPKALMHPSFMKRMVALSSKDDLAELSNADWIVEAVAENLELKQLLYHQIDQVRKKGSIVSSNTSTLLRALLTKGMSKAFQQDFLITHFFNPPRYMRLLEVISGPEVDDKTLGSFKEFATHRLGKTVIDCPDSPGFIANRLGILWMLKSVQETRAQKIPLELADVLLGKPCGFPKTGIFKLLDLIGLDLMPHVIEALTQALPQEDLLHTINAPLPEVEALIAKGYTGRKGRGGFYRLDEQKNKETFDFESQSFRPAHSPKTESAKVRPKTLKAFLQSDTKESRFVFSVIGPTLLYATQLVGSAAHNLKDVDDAMRLGYGWSLGPFELIDLLGADWLRAQLQAHTEDTCDFLETAARSGGFYKVDTAQRSFLDREGAYQVIERPENLLLLEDIKRAQKPVLKNGSAQLWDLKDKVYCFEFTSMMNTLDPDILTLLSKSLDLLEKEKAALVIYNEGKNFSLGANLALALFVCNIRAYDEIDQLVQLGQQVFAKMQTSPVPVVSAPSGMALGGGCEVLLHSDRIVAHAESYIGLVEAGVGLIPAWGGCAALLKRATTHPELPKGPMGALQKIFENIATAKVATSAHEARDMMILSGQDQVVMNRDHLLFKAKQAALDLLGKDRPDRQDHLFHLSGESGRIAFEMAVEGFAKKGLTTPHDHSVARALAHVLTGGDEGDICHPQSEKDILELERKNFMDLVRTPETLARIEQMVLTNKPLRN